MGASDWWRSLRERLTPVNADAARAKPGDAQVAQTSEALRALLDDPDIPPSVRVELGADFAQIESLLDKLKTGELHIAVFGRVSVGKSALGNALLGREAFTTGVLHGTTRARGTALSRRVPRQR